MKIVIATPLRPPEIGGPATDAFLVSEELRRKGYEVVFIPFSSVRKYPKFIKHLRYLLKLFIEGHHSSCIVAFDTVSVGVPAAFYALATRTPLIVRVPGDYAWEQGTQRFGVIDDFDVFQKKRYSGPVEVLRMFQRFVVTRAEAVLAPSDYFARVVEGWGVPRERVYRTYLGIAPSRAIKQEREEKHIISSGRLVSWKGFPLVINLLTRLPEWRATILGDGPMRATLVAYAHEKGVHDRLFFTGATSRDSVMTQLARGSVFVLNTSWESFSFQILEAMASGIPVITTNAGSLAELVRDGVDGILCAPNDLSAFYAAVVSTHERPEVWEPRVASAQHRAESFSQEAAMEAFMAVLKEKCR